jgi:hypothetical protein
MARALVGYEDLPSLAIIEKLLAEHPDGIEIGTAVGGNGFGDLKRKISAFAESSRHQPVLVLTDLDAAECAPALVSDWLSTVPFAPTELRFRVAVRETEAWLIADHDSLRRLLEQPALVIPDDPDTIGDPKAWLLDAASRSRKGIRDLLVRDEEGLILRSVDYNNTLSDFARMLWSPSDAAPRSESLRRARAAIATF